VLDSFHFEGGAEPSAVLVQGLDGNFYGTTRIGGDAPPNFALSFPDYTEGCGTVFKVDLDGNLTILHNFSGPDGANPISGLTVGSDGNLYGLAKYGGTQGTHTTFAGGCGTIFKIDEAGNFTVLHQFNCDEGENPVGELIEGSDGAFYGVTNTDFNNGFGTIFKITPAGAFTVLHSFNFNTESISNPRAGLIDGFDGFLYGTAFFNSVYKTDLTGKISVLHTFSGPDGDNPTDKLALGSDGLLYGTTSVDGGFGDGTVFKTDKKGKLSTLQSFAAPNFNPIAGVIQRVEDGLFYGTAQGRSFSGGGF